MKNRIPSWLFRRCAGQWTIVFAIFILAGSTAWGAPPSPENTPDLNDSSTLQDYLRFAALNNPELEAAFNQWRAGLERIPQVKALPDPRFTYSYYIREVETRTGPQEHAFALMQTFPWFGKLRLQGQKAFEESEALREQYEATRLRLFYEVQDAYYERVYLGRAIAIIQENRDLTQHLEEVARTRYEAAAVPYADVVRSQVELGKLEERLISLREMDSPIRARLNATLNLPPDTPLPWPKSIPDIRINTSAEELLLWAEDANPKLRELAHEITKQEHAVSLAKKNYWPDVTLGVNYIETDRAMMSGVRGSSKDPIIASISINLPLWFGKRRAAVREAKRMGRVAAMRKANMENTLGSEIKMAYYRLRDAERKIDLYGNALLPKAEESLNATETAYQAGKASFSDLIDAQRVHLEFTLDYQRALADCNQRFAKLEMLVGKNIPRTEAPTPSVEVKEGEEQNE